LSTPLNSLETDRAKLRNIVRKLRNIDQVTAFLKQALQQI